MIKRVKQLQVHSNGKYIYFAIVSLSRFTYPLWQTEQLEKGCQPFCGGHYKVETLGILWLLQKQKQQKLYDKRRNSNRTGQKVYRFINSENTINNETTEKDSARQQTRITNIIQRVYQHYLNGGC